MNGPVTIMEVSEAIKRLNQVKHLAWMDYQGLTIKCFEDEIVQPFQHTINHILQVDGMPES